MFKLDLGNAEESEIKVPTSNESKKAREFQKNIYFCFIDYVKAFDSVDHNKLWKILKEMGAFIESIAMSHSTSYTRSGLTSSTTIQRFPETPISSYRNINFSKATG